MAPQAPPAARKPPVTSAAPPTRPIPALAVAWTVLVASDRSYYDMMKSVRDQRGPDVAFPVHPAERRIRLTGDQMRIGRRSATRELKPEIDLAEQPVDPGVSRLHAVLIATPEGNWSILDPGSANGTLLNGREIPAGEQIPLHEGDRINLGAWTVISMHRS
jgi:FHA domain